MPGNPNTLEVADYTSFGVLRLTLHPTSYDWQFVPRWGAASRTREPARATPRAIRGPVGAVADRRRGRQRRAPRLDARPPTAARRSRTTRSTEGRPRGAETLLTTRRERHVLRRLASRTARSTTTASSAVNSVGEGAQSNEASATPAPPRRSRRAAVLDNFAGAPGASAPSWQSPGLADAGTVADRGQRPDAASGAGAGSATWKAGTFAADQEAYLTVPTLPAGGQLPAGGRARQHARRRRTSPATSCA